MAHTGRPPADSSEVKNRPSEMLPPEARRYCCVVPVTKAVSTVLLPFVARLVVPTTGAIASTSDAWRSMRAANFTSSCRRFRKVDQSSFDTQGNLCT